MALTTGRLFALAFLLYLSTNSKAVPLEYVPDTDDNIYNEVEQLLSLNRAVRQGGAGPTIAADQHTSSEESVDKPDIPRLVKNWPQEDLQLGQVTAVSVNSALQPVIFHRADRVWDRNTFNQTHHFQQSHLGTIKEHTVLTLDIQTGSVLGKWGEDMFYMPHGLTIDRHDNFWLTDVALHQAFKFKPGELQPTLIFGERFTPGSDPKHLCKPTSIAIASTGEIFIADGYCNSRILKYNAAGGLLRTIPNPPEFLSLQVPHSLALIESMDRLCIADRENMRVVCPRAGLYSVQGKKEPALTIQQPDMGRVFGVAARGYSTEEIIHLFYTHGRNAAEARRQYHNAYAERPTPSVSTLRYTVRQFELRHSLERKKRVSPRDVDEDLTILLFFEGKIIYAVNGFTSPVFNVQGLTIDPETESVIDHWAPEGGFTNPHDIAICSNGSALYVVEIGPNKVWKFDLVPPKK